MTIRPERATDCDKILRLTYDAFLTLDFPGRRRMDEHFLLSLLQNSSAAINELRFVAERDGVILGHIFYSRTAFLRPDGTHAETATFGPLSVLPKFQKTGTGRALVAHSLDRAAKLGFGGAVITGVPDYYPRLGFKRAADYGITLSDGTSPEYLMVYELIPGYFNGGGVYDTWPPEFDQAEQDDRGYEAFNIAFAKKFFPGELKLRPLFYADVELMKKWIYMPHVAKWYLHPEHWLNELKERKGEFSFLHHFIAEYEGVPIGFCQYYDCFYAREHEVWNDGWQINERKGEVFSIDYLIGEPSYLRRGFGREMIVQMLDMIKEAGGKSVIVQPEKENGSSRKALESCGFKYNGEDYVYEVRE